MTEVIIHNSMGRNYQTAFAETILSGLDEAGIDDFQGCHYNESMDLVLLLPGSNCKRAHQLARYINKGCFSAKVQ
jgi:hypothetical protein